MVTEMTFELRDRRVGTKEAPFGNTTVGSYSNGFVYLGLPDGQSRRVAVFPDGKDPFYGLATRIEPFGSGGVEQPHLKLTVIGEFYQACLLG